MNTTTFTIESVHGDKQTFVLSSAAIEAAGRGNAGDQVSKEMSPTCQPSGSGASRPPGSSG